MILVSYQGRLGNNLFQYCLGRIVAEKLGYALFASPIPGFRNTGAPVPGLKVQPCQSFDNPHRIDMSSLDTLKGKSGVRLEGYYQRYEYYRNHKYSIKEWLQTEPFREFEIHADDVVLHLRRTDRLDNTRIYSTYQGSLRGSTDLLCFDWYEKILNSINFRRLYICSNVPGDPFIRNFDRFEPVFFHKSPIEDFIFIKSFNNIISSISTFSWWASFLSNATTIFMPQPNYGCWGDVLNIDLKIDDESRYVNIPTSIEPSYTYF